MFPKMTEILPEVEGERFSIKKFTVSKESCELMALRDCFNRRKEYSGLQPGTYVKLVDKQTGLRIIVLKTTFWAPIAFTCKIG